MPVGRSAHEVPIPPKITLPRNISTTLRGLEDFDLETLQREVGAELKRRRTEKRTQAVEEIAPFQALSATNIEPPEVPVGQANRIRASHQAGMKPLAIARSLRISKSAVDRVLGLAGDSKAQAVR
jgi:hypothetical protein